MNIPPPDINGTSLPEHGSGRFLALICLVASLGGLLFGFDTAVISGTVARVSQQFKLDDILEGWFMSSALIGCIVGAAVAGVLCDRFGRKPVLIVAGVLFFFSALFCTIPATFTVLVIARTIGGLGIGIASVVGPMYITEFAPPRIRGRLVALYQLSIVLGILAAYFSNWALLDFAKGHPTAFAAESWQHRIFISEIWRAMFAVGMIPAVLFILFLLTVPESPRWLANEGRFDRALAILARVSGRDDARREIEEIHASLDQEEGRFSELFQPGLRIALMVGVMLSVFGQLSGVNIVVYYGPKILQAANFQETGAFLSQVGFGLILLVVTIIALVMIDRSGRRPLLIYGMAGVALFLGVIGALFFFGASGVTLGEKGDVHGTVSSAVGLWIAIAMSAYIACNGISISAVIWVLIPELYPNRVRGRAASVATLANWATNAASAFIFPWLVGRCGMHGGFFASAAICVVATIFFWRFVPETKGKSLEEIDQYWKR